MGQNTTTYHYLWPWAWLWAWLWAGRPPAVLLCFAPRSYLCCLGCLGCCALPAQAQQMAFHQYTTQEGLPHANVFALAQDSAGFLWVGTELGMARFDGQRFTPYGTAQGLPGQIVTQLAIRADTLWAGCYRKGVAAFAIGQHRAAPLGLARFGQGNQLWLASHKAYGSKNNALVEVTVLHDTLLTAEQPLPFAIENFVPSTKAWWLLSKGTLYAWPHGHAPHRVSAPLPKAPATFLAPAPAGGCWVGGKGWLMRLDATQKVLAKWNALPPGKVDHVLLDSQNRLWIAVLGKGLYREQHGKLLPISPRLGLQGTDITALFEDASGNIWLGTYGQGLLCLYPSAMATYTQAQGLSSNYIETIAWDVYRQCLWVGTRNGLHRVGQGVVSQLPPPLAGTGLHEIRHVAVTRENVWVAAPQAMARAQRRIVNQPPLAYYKGAAMAPTTTGSALLGSWANTLGIASLSEEAKDSVITMFGEDHTRTNVIYPDSAGYWVGKHGGLYKVPASLAAHQVSQPLPHMQVYDVLRQRKGMLWVATEQGLYRRKAGSFEAYPLPVAFGAQHCAALAEDHLGRLWVATFGGLFCLDHGGQWTHYTTGNGLPANTLNTLAFAPNDSSLWVGSSAGLTQFRLSQPPPRPTRHTHHIKVQLLKAVTQQRHWVPQPGAHHDFAPRLPYLRLEYVALHLSAPHQVQYRYRLQRNGTPGEWLPSSQTQLALPELQAGAYRLELQASTNGRQWGPGTVFHFSIRPPLWQRGWFLGLLATGLALTVAGYIQLRNLRIRKQEAAKHKAELRMAQLRHQALGAMMNPHFVFNALNSIQQYMHTHQPAEADEYLGKFARLIRANMDFASRDLVPLGEELERLQLYIDLEQLRRQHPFAYHVRIAQGLAVDQLLIPAMLLQPYVENAIWHGLPQQWPNGQICLSIGLVEGRALEISIEDNGVGINATKLKKEAVNTEPHRSKGMAFTQERLAYLTQLTGQAATVETTDLGTLGKGQSGTRITLKIPFMQGA